MEISTLMRLNDRKIHAIEVDPNPERKKIPPDGRLLLQQFTAPFTKTIEATFDIVLTYGGLQYWAALMDGSLCIERRQIDRVRGIHEFAYKGDRYKVRALAHREHDPV